MKHRERKLSDSYFQLLPAAEGALPRPFALSVPGALLLSPSPFRGNLLLYFLKV